MNLRYMYVRKDGARISTTMAYNPAILEMTPDNQLKNWQATWDDMKKYNPEEHDHWVKITFPAEAQQTITNPKS